VEVVVAGEDVGDADDVVAAAGHRAGDHGAVDRVSGQHSGGRVVQQLGVEEVGVSLGVVPGLCPGVQGGRGVDHAPGDVRCHGRRARRAVDPLGLEQDVEAGARQVEVGEAVLDGGAGGGAVDAVQELGGLGVRYQCHRVGIV